MAALLCVSAHLPAFPLLFFAFPSPHLIPVSFHLNYSNETTRIGCFALPFPGLVHGLQVRVLREGTRKRKEKKLKRQTTLQEVSFVFRIRFFSFAPLT